ncbi:hypothetical protein RhiirA4_472575 [Rhizophagus irregularis]|uniref:Uncharacterized protein n=1 Tax=Rhizophagus irregularis TaxID=588596 RepID=A0A2I1H569_9GLOM|nr:hypothetical protein RhiirA4_472575 [Rhizophagus irregularis]
MADNQYRCDTKDENGEWFGGILQEYTTLNDEFKNRLKDENRRTDEVEVEEKRPIVESPSRNEIRKNRGSEEEENKRIKKILARPNVIPGFKKINISVPLQLTSFVFEEIVPVNTILVAASTYPLLSVKRILIKFDFAN